MKSNVPCAMAVFPAPGGSYIIEPVFVGYNRNDRNHSNMGWGPALFITPSFKEHGGGLERPT